MAAPTAEEREAFLWMQGRLVELLLRHHQERFSHTFDERSLPPERGDSRLERYRRLAVVFYLRGELFESILPRIKRRLSFEAPREVSVEVPPTRGSVDWGRTASATWRERPGEVPLEVYTRARRRHFATPENLLTVATLIEFRAVAGRLLDAEAQEAGAHALRHPLNDIVESCGRELLFPQFAGLVQETGRIVDGYAAETTDDLEREVDQRLLPGRNSAYDDLLSWRRRFADLKLLDRLDLPEPQPMLGADPARDNYLYQLWLFYELGDLLRRRQQLQSWDQRRMVLEFRWGNGDGECAYRLQHDQAIPGMPKYWPEAPGVRPDFYIERADRREVRYQDAVVWREPGYVLDAKYYKPHDSAKAPSSPVKRMIADLQLAGERHGALIFAFQAAVEKNTPNTSDDPPDENLTFSEVGSARALYEVAPRHDTAQAIVPSTRIGIWRARPEIGGDNGNLTQMLLALLEATHEALRERVPVRCHGLFLDTLTATAHGDLSSGAGLLARDGSPLAEPLDDLLVCPKPHVAGWRVDLVSNSRDCCQNASVCHILGQPGVDRPRRLVQLKDIQEAIRGVTDEGDEEAATRLATEHVLTITKRYVELFKPDMKRYQRRLRDMLDVDDLFDTTPLLTDVQRHTLQLGLFLWDQIDLVAADNFAGPILLFTGVLEWAVQQSIFPVQWARQPLTRDDGRPIDKTLGALGYSKMGDKRNFYTLEATLVTGGYWREQLPDEQVISFSKWISTVASITQIRNDAAHRAIGDAATFKRLAAAYFGSPKTGLGLLAGLLLAWVPEGHTVVDETSTTVAHPS